MAKLTLSVSKELKERMDSLPEVNWPEVLRRRLRARLDKLMKFEELQSKGVV